jgi:small conductance mechanosensitive channel
MVNLLARALPIALSLVTLVAATAQDGAPGEAQDPPVAAAGEALAPLPTPDSVAAALELRDELDELEGRSRAELEVLRDGWMKLARGQERELEQALRAPRGTPARDAADSLRADLDALLTGVESIAAALAATGVDTEGLRAEVAALRAQGKELLLASTAPETRQQALELPVEALRAQLRPLTREQVEQQLEQWLPLLQRASLEVRNVEVSAILGEDQGKVDELNARAVSLRGERAALIKRVEAVIHALERKGGDVEVARAYVSSVVAKPPITGWRAAWTTARAWLTDREGGLALGRSLGTALLILIAFWALSTAVARVVGRAARAMQYSSQLLCEFLESTARRLTLLIGALIALSTLGINMTPLVAAIGAAGLVIGLALQGTLGNLASGLMIMVYRPFDVGDAVQTGGASGSVFGMTLMTTTIKSFDNQTIHVPNSMIWNDVITNVTANATRRVDMRFGIGYDDDVALAKQLLGTVLEQHPLVLADPAPMIRVHELGDSSVNLIVRPWAKTKDYWEVFWSVTEEVKRVFKEHDVSIPFPQRDVHLYPAAAAEREAVGSSATES